MKGKKVVIIGSGMGGLACGLMLAKEGMEVTILEKNRQFGGNLQIFVREKCIFDTGVHYIGGLDKGQNLYKFFKYFEIMDDLKLLKCDEDGYDKITFKGDNNEYFHAQGYDNFVKQLLKQFPEEEEGLKKYCNKLQEICLEFPIYRLEKSSPEIVMSEALSINAKDFIDSCTTNQKLRDVLAATNALYEGIADETPLYVHALILNSYIEGAYKCVDGGAQIERLLVKKIKEYGGEVLRYKDVTEIVCNDAGEVDYLKTKEGETFKGDYYISNADIPKTLGMLTGSKIRKAYKKRIDNLNTTISCFILNIVLKENSFPYQNFNHYHHLIDNVWDTANYTEENWPLGVAVFCPPSTRTKEHAESITLFSYMKYDDVKQWKDTFHTIPKNVNEREETYHEFKERHAQKLLDSMEEVYPNLRDCIQSYYTSTPLTYRDYIGSEDGTMYGITKDHKDPIKSFISPKTKVPNLLLTGANINLHGILGVTISALVTCNHLVDPDKLLEKIHAASE